VIPDDDPPQGLSPDWVLVDADPAHVKREREKARELRKSAWWQRKLQQGLCAYCGKRFPAAELTMDHVVPVARGGRSTKGNVVPCCKPCNNAKKLLTPAELLLRAQRIAKDESDD
jgi:5-methylcytosine-specific restriction endonuclease McrA